MLFRPIWYHSDPSNVPYSSNQFLDRDFILHFLRQSGSSLSYVAKFQLECVLTLVFFTKGKYKKNQSVMFWGFNSFKILNRAPSPALIVCTYNWINWEKLITYLFVLFTILDKVPDRESMARCASKRKKENHQFKILISQITLSYPNITISYQFFTTY